MGHQGKAGEPVYHPLGGNSRNSFVPYASTGSVPDHQAGLFGSQSSLRSSIAVASSRSGSYSS